MEWFLLYTLPSISHQEFSLQINALTPFVPSPYTESNPAQQPNTKENTKQNNSHKIQDTNDAQSLQSQISPLTTTQEIADKQAQNLLKTDENPHPERITYGLRILELMSDEEYRAFVFASQGLSESQKMLMAQGLYRFTDFYQGRKESERAQLDAKMQRQLKAFGAQNSQIEGFINRYKNAYAQILSEGYLG